MKKELDWIRNKVIMACHEDCGSYEEAFEKEKDNHREELGELLWEAWQVGTMSRDDFCLAVEDDDFFEETLGRFCLPITLAKLLIALPLIETLLWRNCLEFKTHEGYCSPAIKFKWDLSKDLDQQEPKVILAISKLLGYE